MTQDTTYYDSIADGYNYLHKEEQLRKLRKIAQHLCPSGRLLDVGCGTGISTDFFAEQCECVGIDPSAKLIEKNVNGFSSFVVGFAEELPFSDAEFDVVVSLTAIQNFDNVEQGLSEIKRVGKKTFALTWLKKSSKSSQIMNIVEHIFGEPMHKLEDEHDWIYLYGVQ